MVDKFGSQLEQLDRRSKFLLLSSIALCAAVDAEDYPLEEAFSDLPFDEMNEDLQAMLPQLYTLTGDNLLGLCEGLVAQLLFWLFDIVTTFVSRWPFRYTNPGMIVAGLAYNFGTMMAGEIGYHIWKHSKD